MVYVRSDGGRTKSAAVELGNNLSDFWFAKASLPADETLRYVTRRCALEQRAAMLGQAALGACKSSIRCPARPWSHRVLDGGTTAHGRNQYSVATVPAAAGRAPKHVGNSVPAVERQHDTALLLSLAEATCGRATWSETRPRSQIRVLCAPTHRLDPHGAEPPRPGSRLSYPLRF